MKLLNLYSIKGPNIYSYNPVIVMDIDLEEYHKVYTDELPSFTQALVQLFPGLQEHHCSLGRPGGLIERFRRGTLLGHVMEHLALELQSMVSKPVHFGKTRYSDEIQGYRIVYSYRNEILGLQAGKLSFSIIQSLLQGKNIDIKQIRTQLEDGLFKESYGPSTQAIVEAAHKRGIPVIPLSSRSSLIQLGYGSQQKRIQATITGQTSCVGVDISCDKWETRELLDQAGLPVARGYMVQTLNEAEQAMGKLGKPVVVKPLNGNQGKGVTLNISALWELKRAFELSLVYGEQVMIEEYIKGNDYRLTIVNGKLVAASHRLPPFVIGDGEQTIRQLVQQINSDIQRGEGHEKPLTQIRIDEIVLMNLVRNNLSLDTVVPIGRQVFLRENGNLSTGGTAYDVTDLVHPENRLIVERAVRMLGLDVAGVDLRTEDISRPISRYAGAIIEINAAPGIRMHQYPTVGKKRDVAADIVRMLFPEGNGRIPLFAITGTNGKTTTTRLIHHILLQIGQNVGMTTTDGIYLNRNLLVEGDTTGPWSAELLLKDPMVDMAVLEIARGGLIRGGLAYDQSDVGIILNVSEDHLGLKGIETLEDLASVKSLIAETVHPKGVCVLNADDEYTVQMAERVLGRIIYFTQNPQSDLVQKHIAKGEIAVVADHGILVAWQSKKKTELMDLCEIPMTLQGQAKHQVENVLAAVAGLYGYGIDLKWIQAGLRSFTGDIQTNPGRLNIIEQNGWKLILDYAHNLEGYRAILNFAQSTKYQRLMGVVGVPGDRQDQSILKIGELIGDHFDQIWIKEDSNLRGRKQGEVAKLLQKGIIQGAKLPSCQVIYDEKVALEAMLAVLQPGDIGIIFYEKDPKSLLKLVEDRLEKSLQEIEVEKNLVVSSSR